MVLEVKAAPSLLGKLGWERAAVPPLAAKLRAKQTPHGDNQRSGENTSSV